MQRMIASPSSSSSGGVGSFFFPFFVLLVRFGGIGAATSSSWSLLCCPLVALPERLVLSVEIEILAYRSGYSVKLGTGDHQCDIVAMLTSHSVCALDNLLQVWIAKSLMWSTRVWISQLISRWFGWLAIQI